MARPWHRTDLDETPDEEDGTKARAFWSGTLSFGLVSVPVALFPASREGRASLRMLAPDGTPLERRWYCPEDERNVSWDELVRGYELDDGGFVVMSDEEIESAAPEKSRDIDLRRFVPRDQLDPLFFERGYFLVPAGQSTKAYRLLARAMEEGGVAGIATFVMRTREYLVAILASDGVLRAETLRWAGEVRTPDDVGLPEPARAPDARVKAVQKAIDALAADALEEDELADRRTAQLEKLVARKLRSGEDVLEAPEVGAAPSDEGIIDLMEVLKRSLEGTAAGAGRRRGEKGRAAPARTADDLAAMSREDLYERARELDVRGRSGMTKSQLAAAIRKAG